ncbi:adult-specific cuticular protein ACP-20-like [Frankliniella occidentalis]|uniref:Adult-specific cuticular protein ACP-20-like n=1 Tax=Frankliniella occidentalis TaxID=133901 RepID=A0A6J1SBA5_FRAOC|nr:adult-specific cuticular protein ACP-20-like [Frankliniella occidentalis]
MAAFKVLVVLSAVVGSSLAFPGGHSLAESYASVNLLNSLGHGGGLELGGHGGGLELGGHGGGLELGGHGGIELGGHGGHEEEHIILAHPKYEFKYGVEDSHTGDYKDQKEERDGDVVKGEYSLLQPDGRKRIVHYTASKHGGFNAIVSYSGHAIHPEVHGHPDIHGHGQ